MWAREWTLNLSIYAESGVREWDLTVSVGSLLFLFEAVGCRWITIIDGHDGLLSVCHFNLWWEFKIWRRFWDWYTLWRMTGMSFDSSLNKIWGMSFFADSQFTLTYRLTSRLLLDFCLQFSIRYKRRPSYGSGQLFSFQVKFSKMYVFLPST